MVAEKEGDWQETVDEPTEPVAEATPEVVEETTPEVDVEGLAKLNEAFTERLQAEIEAKEKELQAHFNSVADKNTKRREDELMGQIGTLQSQLQQQKEEQELFYGVISRGLEPEQQQVLAQGIQRQRAAAQERQRQELLNDPYLETATEWRKNLMIMGLDPNQDPRFDMRTPGTFVESARPYMFGLMELANQKGQPQVTESPKESKEEPVLKETPKDAPLVEEGRITTSPDESVSEVRRAYANGEIDLDTYERKMKELGQEI